jgi:WD40 repeat protein
VQTGKEIRVLKGNGHIMIGGMATSPDGRRALSADGTVRLWNLKSGEELRQFPVEQPVGVAFSPDGRRALSASYRIDLVKLWDLETGAGVREMHGHTAGPNNVVFLPGGRQALSSSNDQTLRLWDLDNGHEIRRFCGHTHEVKGVAITRDGTSLFHRSHRRCHRRRDFPGW